MLKFNMAGFFDRFLILCICLFGVKPCAGDNNSGQLPITAGFLKLLEISDVTSIGNDFVSRNDEFYRNMAKRHRVPNNRLSWHFMSGAAAFVPNLNSNILFERLFYTLQPGRGGHVSVPEKSFVAFTQWSSDWTTPIAPTQILHVNETKGSMYTDDLVQRPRSRATEGPEDARVIFNPEKEEINLNFNVLTPIGDRQMFGQTVKLFRDGYALKYNKTEPLGRFEHLNGYRAGIEKNWAPILIKGELHYVYSLSPLRIIKCEVETGTSAAPVVPVTPAPAVPPIRYYVRRRPKETIRRQVKEKDFTSYKKICRVQFNGEAVNSGSQTGALRSGTNWVEHFPGVYFSFGRTRMLHRKCSNAIYRPHLVVLKFNIDSESGAYSDPHLISVSDPITEFDNKLFELYAKKGLVSGNMCWDKAVLTPGSISRWTRMTENEDSDVADVIISINDDITALLRIKGIDQIVQKAIDSAPSFEQNRLQSKELVQRAELEMRKFLDYRFF